MPPGSSPPEAPAGESGPAASAGFLLWRAALRWQRLQRDALAPLGLTHVQFVLLAAALWLADRGEPATQVAIAARADADVMMTSQVLRALERRGMLRRAPHPTDARARIVEATAAGRALFRRAVRQVEQVDAAFFGRVRGEGGEVRRWLRRLVAD